MYFSSRRLATALAARAFAELQPPGAPAVRAVVELLQVTNLLVVALPLLAIVQPFLETVEGVGIVVISVVALAVIVVRSARCIQGQIRGATRLIRIALSAAYAEPDSDQSREVPGIGMITPVSLQPDSEGVGKSLSELDLHTNSGAVVVAIGRGGAEVVIPTGDEILRPGDVLELAGSTDAVAAARRLLEARRSAALEQQASP
jgi:CPA2 family monovalent cation:H+ antiporter-2